MKGDITKARHLVISNATKLTNARSEQHKTRTANYGRYCDWDGGALCQQNLK